MDRQAGEFRYNGPVVLAMPTQFRECEPADSRFREVETALRAILYRLGRMLQIIGMILLPLAIAGNLSPEDPLSLKESLSLSGAGIGIFTVGWLIQRAGIRP
jgi:hypothetical protein